MELTLDIYRTLKAAMKWEEKRNWESVGVQGARSWDVNGYIDLKAASSSDLKCGGKSL